MEPHWLGYFTSAEQTKPAYDPGPEVICPVCLKQLSEPRSTISLFLPGDHRSFFFRVHRGCKGGADDVESAIVDARAADTKEQS